MATAHVTNYDRLDDGSVPGKADLQHPRLASSPDRARSPRSCLRRARTSTGWRTPAGAPTITIHTYGDPGTKATVFDLKGGTYETVDLRFHNLGEP